MGRLVWYAGVRISGAPTTYPDQVADGYRSLHGSHVCHLIVMIHRWDEYHDLILPELGHWCVRT